MKKRFLYILILFFTTFRLFSNEGIELDNINSSWTRVLPGNLICEPQTTSYGFAVITDAKHLMGFTSGGKTIFETSLTKANTSFFGVLTNDFLAVITNSGKKLTLLNPDGQEIWNINMNYKINSIPISGRDGRFFVRGDNYLTCFSITGIQKWEIQTPSQSNIPLQELPDGSIVLMLSELVNGKTKAIRITPFGEIIEDITFSGQILKALTTPKGILLTFSDGSCGLFSLENNISTHKWLLQKKSKQKNNSDFFILSQNKENVAYINYENNAVQVNYINLDDGTIPKSFFIYDMQAPQYGWYNESGILLVDSKNACFYNNSGRYLWSGNLPSKKSKFAYSYTSFTVDNCFVLFNDDWSMHAYKTATVVDEKKEDYLYKKNYNYNSFYNIDTTFYEIQFPLPIDSDLIDNKKYEKLQEGNYSTTEIDYISQIYSALTYYKSVLSSSSYGYKNEKSVFQTDTSGMEKLLSQMSLYGTDIFVDYTSDFLRLENNRAYLHTILQGITVNPYDPDGKIMESIEYLIRKITNTDDLILKDICDAVYALCSFNGYAAIEPRGKDILTSFLYPKYKSIIRDYARNTLKKLIGK